MRLEPINRCCSIILFCKYCLRFCIFFVSDFDNVIHYKLERFSGLAVCVVCGYWGLRLWVCSDCSITCVGMSERYLEMAMDNLSMVDAWRLFVPVNVKLARDTSESYQGTVAVLLIYR